MVSMIESKKIETISIKGFQSIKSLDNFRLHNLNVLIGANGAGKSNFVNFFRFLNELLMGRLQLWVSKQGGSDRVLTYGVKHTQQMQAILDFGDNRYEFVLEPTALSGLTFAIEKFYYSTQTDTLTVLDTLTIVGDELLADTIHSFGSGHSEAKLALKQGTMAYTQSRPLFNATIFHFHDTSETAAVKQLKALHDNDFLRSDASNLAAFLYQLLHQYPDVYQEIRKVIQLAIPFFDDFDLKPSKLSTGEEQLQLRWLQKQNDYPFLPSQLSDGTLRFICLTTALLQPNPPTTIIIDEPELGLHPYAIALIGALIRSASKRVQIIISTQSVTLLNEFMPNDIVIIEREADFSTFKRLDESALAHWLEDYSLGELWEKNILGGMPTK
jgi:predicted ATPase